MSTDKGHRNDPRPRMGKCAKPLLTGDITKDTIQYLIKQSSVCYQKEILKIPELRNTLQVRPWLLYDFSFVDSDDSIYHAEPTIVTARELQESCQNILQAYCEFTEMARFDLKTDVAWRTEFLANIELKFSELVNYERFRSRITVYDSTGNHDYELIRIVDLYGLSDLVEYSMVLLASEPSLIKTVCPLPSQDNPNAVEPGVAALLGRCLHGHKFFIRDRVDQRFCSEAHRHLGPILEELE